MSDTIKKSILKTISWRCIGFMITGALVFIFTKNVVVATSIGFFDLIIKLIVYFIHERMWSRMNI